MHLRHIVAPASIHGLPVRSRQVVLHVVVALCWALLRSSWGTTSHAVRAECRCHVVPLLLSEGTRDRIRRQSLQCCSGILDVANGFSIDELDKLINVVFLQGLMCCGVASNLPRRVNEPRDSFDASQHGRQEIEDRLLFLAMQMAAHKPG